MRRVPEPEGSWFFPRSWAGKGARAGGASSFGWFGDDASGEVEEVLVDLAEGAHLLLQLAHLDRQVLLVSHQVLRQKKHNRKASAPGSGEAAAPAAANPRPFCPLPPPPTQTAAPPAYTAASSRALPRPIPTSHGALRMVRLERGSPEVCPRRDNSCLGAALTFSLVEYICEYIFSAFSR